MPFPKLEGVIPHLKLAAIDALMRENGFTTNGTQYEKIIAPVATTGVNVIMTVSTPDSQGQGGGDVETKLNPSGIEVDLSPLSPYITLAQKDIPQRFTEIRQTIETLFTPFFSLPYPDILKEQEQILGDALRDLYLTTADSDTSTVTAKLPTLFNDMIKVLGPQGGESGETGVAIAAFRTAFLERIKAALHNTSKETAAAYVSIAAQAEVIAETRKTILSIAFGAISLFNSVTESGSGETVTVLLKLAAAAATAAAAALGVVAVGFTGVGAVAALTLASLGLDYLASENEKAEEKNMELKGPTHADCMNSLSTAVQACADKLLEVETQLAKALSAKASNIKGNPESYNYETTGDPGFTPEEREDIRMRSGNLKTVANYHLPNAISCVENAYELINFVKVEDAARRDPQLGHSDIGAMSECTDVILLTRDALADLIENLHDGQINLAATVASFENAEDLTAVDFQKMSAEAMRD
ncbi:hypothetical protein [Buchananella hordeovulneris]|uniref:hypothetical protein n=1 Tax=Buchananella hordeovulneris TaxID=52770 RepID=UPI000F603106|nr:hypothetical protein [Buchananella hordeovulneris]RRD42128.1 hypothetical protein EII13_10185 [Buchananella hordeovulneris]